MPPSSIHSPSRPLTTVLARCTLTVPTGPALVFTVSRCGLISNVTRSPETRGNTEKPVVTSRYAVASVITTPPEGVRVTTRLGTGWDVPTWITATLPSITCSVWVTRLSEASCEFTMRPCTLLPPPLESVPETAAARSLAAPSAPWRTEIFNCRGLLSMLASTRRRSAMLLGLARMTSWFCMPVSAPPGSTSGCSTGITCSALR